MLELLIHTLLIKFRHNWLKQPQIYSLKLMRQGNYRIEEGNLFLHLNYEQKVQLTVLTTEVYYYYRLRNEFYPGMYSRIYLHIKRHLWLNQCGFLRSRQTRYKIYLIFQILEKYGNAMQPFVKTANDLVMREDLYNVIIEFIQI